MIENAARVQLTSGFSSELIRNVMAGELNLALVTAPPETSQITAISFAQTPLYAAVPRSHRCAQQEYVALQDLAKDDWILLARRLHPALHDAILEAAQREGIAPKHAHAILTTQEAVDLVSHHVGVAIVTKPEASVLGSQEVALKPISDTSLCFDTCLIMRANDDSHLANQFARSFLRRYELQVLPPKQMELSLSA